LLGQPVYDTVTDIVGERNGQAVKLDRGAVVASALDLVLREGPAALTMRRLATELDVATPTIYWHVGSREELVTAVIEAQAERLAERPVVGTTPRARVLSAARHIYAGAVAHRPITSLAHQTGTSSLLLGRLEEVLVSELEAAGLADEARAGAQRAILVTITGALVLTLRERTDPLWVGCDLDALTTDTLRAVVDHHVPSEEGE